MSDLMLIRTPAKNDSYTYFEDKGGDYAIIDGQVEVIARFNGDEPLFIECEHTKAGTLCDEMCDAYVQGEGMIRVWPKEESNDE